MHYYAKTFKTITRYSLEYKFLTESLSCQKFLTNSLSGSNLKTRQIPKQLLKFFLVCIKLCIKRYFMKLVSYRKAFCLLLNTASRS